MTEYTIRIFPNTGDMFAQEAFDEVVGGTVLFTSPVTGKKGYGILKAAEVEHDGYSASLTIDFEEPELNGYVFQIDRGIK